MTSESNAVPATVGLAGLLSEYADQLVGAALATVSTDGEVEVAFVGRPDASSIEPVTAATPFSLGSVTKLLTAGAICQMVEAGQLSFEDPLVRWLPEVRKLTYGAEITIQHLLCHSSGLVDLFEPIAGIDALIDRLANFGPIAKPGALLSYTNVGYILLGEVIRRIAADSWENEVRRRFLQPLGMSSTWLGDESNVPERPAVDHDFTPDGSVALTEMWPRLPGIFAAAGTTATASVEDAVRLLGALLFGCVANIRLFSDPLCQAMQNVQIAMPGPGVFGDGWGLGWCVIDETQDLVGHIGGTSVFALGSRALGKAAIFLSNTPNGATIGEALTRRAIGVDASVALIGSHSNSPLGSFVGRYRSPTFAIEIAEEGATLVMSSTMNDERVTLLRIGETTFMGRIGTLPTEVNFITDAANGPPQYLHIALRALARV